MGPAFMAPVSKRQMAHTSATATKDGTVPSAMCQVGVLSLLFVCFGLPSVVLQALCLKLKTSTIWVLLKSLRVGLVVCRFVLWLYSVLIVV